MPGALPRHRDVLDVALPMILANVTVPLVGIADSAAVGRLDDPTSLAGVAVGATVFSVLFTALNFLRMGTTGLAAQAHGAGAGGDFAVLRQGLVVALGLAVALVLVSTPLRALAFALIDPEPAVLAEASAYFSVRLAGAPATLALFVLTGWFIGRGDGRSPLVVVLLVNLLNVALDFAFVLGLGLAARGVALATVISEYSGVALGLALALRARRAAGAAGAAAPPPPWRRFLEVNLPLLLRTAALMLCFAFLTAMGARFGSAVLAANALLLNFLYLASYALDGFANAAESLVGRAVGARDRAMLGRAITLSAQWSAGVAVALSALFFASGPLLVDLMTTQPELRALARDYLPWLVAVPVVGCWAFLFDGVFVGATMTREMRDTMLFAALGVYLPAWWLLQPLGNHGLWAAFLLFFAARGAAQAWLLRRRAAGGGLLPAS